MYDQEQGAHAFIRMLIQAKSRFTKRSAYGTMPVSVLRRDDWKEVTAKAG